jgi:lipopolysaccharide transport system permease protein
MYRTIITSEPESLISYVKKVLRYKQLITVFAKRDLKVKYSQTFLGLAWTVVQPMASLLIFSFFFGYILQWKTGEIPYTLYVLTGLISWNFFSYIVYQGTSSIQESGELIKKIYFPKAILPLSKVCVALVEFCITFVLLIPFLFFYHQPISWHVIFIPLLLILNTSFALFIVFSIGSLAYKMRDLFHIIPFLMNFGIWCTPVFFTKDILPAKINFIWYLNPMASVVEGFRWCLFPEWKYDLNFLPALFMIVPLFIAGFSMYKRAEREFSDYV